MKPTHLRFLKLHSLLAGALTWLFVLWGGSATGGQPPQERLEIAVLTVANTSGNTNAALWRYVIHSSLLTKLGAVRAVRVLPDSEADYAFRRLNLNPSDGLTAEQAEKVAGLIHARRVLWGGYRQEQGQWLVDAQLLEAGSGRPPVRLAAASNDWLALLDQLGQGVMESLGVKLTPAEQAELARWPTRSVAALECYGRGFVAYNESKSPAALLAWARKALAADPQYAWAYAAVAAHTDNPAEAEQALRKALKLRPDYAWAHRALGERLSRQKKNRAALKEWEAAVHLEPDDPDNLCRLAEAYLARGKQNEALRLLEQASRLAPSSPQSHARLGERLAAQGQREKALAELQAAERLAPAATNAPGGAPVTGSAAFEGNTHVMPTVTRPTTGPLDMESELWLMTGYNVLQDFPAMVEHTEKFISLARAQGMAADKLKLMQQRLQQMQQQLQQLQVTSTPHAVIASMPRLFTAAELQAALRERLTPRELALVVNPLASTPAIKQLAEQLTCGATNDLDKAGKLFSALLQHPAAEAAKVRTAQEIFALWNRPGESFCCQDYTKLFIALGREVGLKTFYTHLDKDYAGKAVSHDCPVIFAEGQAWLVDPAYRWFGAAHRQYVVLDDVQAVAHHLYQQQGGSRGLACCRAAAKLHPDLAWGQLRLAYACIASKQWSGAHQAAEAARKLEPDCWEACLVQGWAAIQEGNSPEAIEPLQKATQLNPDNGEAHFHLATALWNDKPARLQEAQTEFQKALTQKLNPKQNRLAAQSLKQIAKEMKAKD